MFIKYQDIALRRKTIAIIEQANKIIEEYISDGFNLTLRQLYYQFVSRDLLANTVRNYNRLGVAISQGRRAGLIDWEAIVDRTRNLETVPTWDSPEDILSSCSDQFRFDLWKDQACYVEVWFEKDALIGVFERAVSKYRIPFFSCRGYVSDSSCWEAACRLRKACRYSWDEVIVLHFGDHDPSGIDMTRDIEQRLNLFDAYPKIERLALNMDQIRRYNPPPNPAKETDSRYGEYVSNYGSSSWELDALEPKVLVELVDKQVRQIVDEKLWEKGLKEEKKERDNLYLISNNYKEAVKAVSK